MIIFWIRWSAWLDLSANVLYKGLNRAFVALSRSLSCPLFDGKRWRSSSLWMGQSCFLGNSSVSFAWWGPSLALGLGIYLWAWQKFRTLYNRLVFLRNLLGLWFCGYCILPLMFSINLLRAIHYVIVCFSNYYILNSKNKLFWKKLILKIYFVFLF